MRLPERLKDIHAVDIRYVHFMHGIESSNSLYLNHLHCCAQEVVLRVIYARNVKPTIRIERLFPLQDIKSGLERHGFKPLIIRVRQKG